MLLDNDLCSNTRIDLVPFDKLVRVCLLLDAAFGMASAFVLGNFGLFDIELGWNHHGFFAYLVVHDLARSMLFALANSWIGFFVRHFDAWPVRRCVGVRPNYQLPSLALTTMTNVFNRSLPKVSSSFAASSLSFRVGNLASVAR